VVIFFSIFGNLQVENEVLVVKNPSLNAIILISGKIQSKLSHG